MGNKKRPLKQKKAYIIIGSVLIIMLVLGGYAANQYFYKSKTVSKSGKISGNTDNEKKGLEVKEDLLTNVAPSPRAVKVTAKESPQQRLKELQLDDPPQKKLKVILPKDGMNLRNPPQWSLPVALPKVPTDAPDPKKAPAIKVDPRRKRQKDVPRLSIGEIQPSAERKQEPETVQN
jgi:hypothetical protein